MDLISTNYNSDVDALSPYASDDDDDDKVDTSNNLEEHPRIGDTFQAKIPPLSVDCDERTRCLQPIPIMWAHLDFDRSDKKVLENGTSLECIQGEDRHITSKVRYPFPGSLGEPWSEVERESFVLGLYIFGKNMKLVKKLVERKEMEDVLSFYYGDFYRSDRYHKWAQFLKRRSNTRSLHGHKIFSAGKLRELFSRLADHMPERSQTELLEVSRAFEEGKIPLEEFVDILKNAVGIDKLIEAVGIGRGKQDLTVANAVKTKTAQPANPTKPKRPLASIRRKMPSLKACSSLSTADIVKLLSGDSRLGKARSNDLFWEAVWPRLLAGGWHSEHRNRHGDSGLNDNLVFLMPGIEKFNRRKLEKGQHYFDTLNEVLSNVALNPSLLNGPSETTEDRRKETVEQQNSGSDDSDVMEITFTIVDTSLFSGGKRTKTRKLKNIANGTEKGFESTSCSSEDEDSTPKEPGDDSSVRETCANSPECVTSTVNNSSSHNALDSTLEESPSTTSCFTSGDQTALSSTKSEVSPAAKCGDSSGSNGSVPEQLRHKTKTMSVNSENKTSSDHAPDSRNESPPQQQHPKPLRLLVKGPSRPKPQQQPTVAERRQSTRSRPLTTKALEAIESDLSLSPHKKRKTMERVAKNDTRIASLSPV